MRETRAARAIWMHVFDACINLPARVRVGRREKVKGGEGGNTAQSALLIFYRSMVINAERLRLKSVSPQTHRVHATTAPLSSLTAYLAVFVLHAAPPLSTVHRSDSLERRASMSSDNARRDSHAADHEGEYDRAHCAATRRHDPRTWHR